METRETGKPPRHFDSAECHSGALAARLGRFDLPTAGDCEAAKQDPPEPRTFDFLGFTHDRSRSQRGEWVVKRKSAERRHRLLL
jgi:hypothetical protein